jgi:hypothetical protein
MDLESAKANTTQTAKKMLTRQAHTKHNPVVDFNAAKGGKLGKLPQLVKYVSKFGADKDFVVSVDIGDDFTETQMRVFWCYSDLTRDEKLENFQRFALYCFMRYSGFEITERPREDVESNGISVKMV